ncbi:hypothetical protein AB1N83_013027 [Pleurotus pulmonarius]
MLLLFPHTDPNFAPPPLFVSLAHIYPLFSCCLPVHCVKSLALLTVRFNRPPAPPSRLPINVAVHWQYFSSTTTASDSSTRCVIACRWSVPLASGGLRLLSCSYMPAATPFIL